MGTLISVFIIIICLLLILIVLIQNSKGGGLSSTFASSNQVMGVRKTADFLEKATWTLAISLLVLSLIATPLMNRSGSDAGPGELETKEKAQNTIAIPQNQPVAPTAPTPMNTNTEEGTEQAPN